MSCYVVEENGCYKIAIELWLGFILIERHSGENFSMLRDYFYSKSSNTGKPLKTVDNLLKKIVSHRKVVLEIKALIS